jgi:hypothetical protein
MEQINYDFLSNELKFLGFGDGLFADLKEMLDTEHSTFELVYRNVIEREPVRALLYFNRPDPEGYFFFSKYALSLGEKQHNFFIFKGKGVTVKEGFNLLNGRAVYKQRIVKNGQKFNEWIELDLTARDENGFRINLYPESHGFDLFAVIQSLQIDTPTANWDRSMLIRSLEKGNLQTAFIREEGTNRKVYISANPKDRTITVHEIEPLEWEKPEETKSGDDIEDTLKTKSKAKKLRDVTR